MKDIKEAIQNIKSIDYLKQVLESYGVKLSNKDNSTKGLCPFHTEKTPSFHLYSHDNKAYYKCFGCGAGGDIANFIKNQDNISTLEAVKKAYDILGLKLDIQPSKIDKLIDYIETNKSYKLEGFKIEDIHIYMLNEDNPSFLKVKYRSLTDKSKKDLRTYKVVDEGEYFKTTIKEKGGDYTPTIYNYLAVKRAIEKDNNIYIVEGEKDVETLKRYGFVATTIYSKKWFNEYSEQLKNSKIVFIGDTGEAGEQFKNLVYDNLKSIVKTFKVVDLPNIDKLGDNADVTDWLNVEGNTKEKLIEAIKSSKLMPLISFGNYYYNGLDTLCRVVNTDKNGEEVEKEYKVYSGSLIINSINIDIDNNKESLELYSNMYGKLATTYITKGELFSKKTYAETLNNIRGFLVEPKAINEVQNYLVEQYKIKDMNNDFKEIIKTNNIGWIEYNNTQTFVYPRYTESLDKKIFYKEIGKYNKIFKPKGDFKTYKDNVLLPLLNTDIGTISITACIASLLLEILDIHESFILDIFGKNGRGKTILLYALASLFGHPNKYSLEWNSTKTAIITNASELNNFPLMLDDTKKCDNKNIITEIIYSLSGGKDKARANQDGTSKEQKTFKNITISTGETSLLNYIQGESSGAGAFGRVLSIDTDIYNIFESKEKADGVADACKKNYGIFGYEFCKWLYEKSINDNVIDEWLEKYNDFKNENYKKVEHHTSTRKANHIAILQLAYDLLEEFLETKETNIYIKGSLFNDFLLEADELSQEQDVYKNSFEEVVQYCFTNPNRLYSKDKDGNFAPNNLIGWNKDNILYISDKELLKGMLDKFGDFNDILKEWKKREYIKTDTNKLQKTAKTPYFVDGKSKTIKTYAINTLYNQNSEFQEVQGTF